MLMIQIGGSLDFGGWAQQQGKSLGKSGFFWGLIRINFQIGRD